MCSPLLPATSLRPKCPIMASLCHLSLGIMTKIAKSKIKYSEATQIIRTDANYAVHIFPLLRNKKTRLPKQARFSIAQTGIHYL